MLNISICRLQSMSQGDCQFLHYAIRQRAKWNVLVLMSLPTKKLSVTKHYSLSVYTIQTNIYIYIYTYIHTYTHTHTNTPWCNGYCHRKWTYQQEFKYLDEAVCISYSTNTLGGRYESSYFPSRYGQIVGFDLVSHSVSAVGLVNTHMRYENCRNI